jgi:hypothetical protein
MTIRRLLQGHRFVIPTEESGVPIHISVDSTIEYEKVEMDVIIDIDLLDTYLHLKIDKTYVTCIPSSYVGMNLYAVRCHLPSRQKRGKSRTSMTTNIQAAVPA